MRRLVCLVIAALGILGCGPDTSQVTDANTNPIDAAIDAYVPDAGATAFGDPCTHHGQCAGGYCVEGPQGGGLCSRECSADCPEGWDCREVELQEGTADVCIPSQAFLCERCADDSQCSGGACITLDSEGRCASDCTVSGTCPNGYQCLPDPGNTHTGMFCQPVTASCTCSSATDGDSRTCSFTNAIGTCWGTQTCDATSGWSQCTAATPSNETCDGVDQDCDFVIDDDVGGGEDCQNTNGFGSCDGIRTCAGADGFVCQGPVPAEESCNFLDDDCDDGVDEAFGDLGDLCQDGMGACLAYGSKRCKADGTGTECSAVAGTPSAETCNGLDDNCDGVPDDPYVQLGDGCTAGFGVCARQGMMICNAGGTDEVCSATPGSADPPERCNYIDDDCDDAIDDGFVNGSGVYHTDANCGACGIDCTAIYAAPNAFGRCLVSGSDAVCDQECNAGTWDLNGATADGCEFVLDSSGIYVSETTGNDGNANCGLGPVQTGNVPCKTIQKGITQAVLFNRTTIYVADGTYGGAAVTLINGRHLRGGYRADTWVRHLESTSTVIQGFTTVNGHNRTVVASGITSPTVFEGFVVRGSSNTNVSGNSYAIYVSGSDADLQIRDNAVQAGRGGPGGVGGTGAVGTVGDSADDYVASTYDAHHAFVGSSAPGPWCSSNENNRSYQNGGDRTCVVPGPDDDVGGGNGGGNQCAPVGNQTQFSALNGAAGQPGAGAGGGAEGSGGTGGSDGRLYVISVCTLGQTAGWTMVGAAGSDGENGDTGDPVGGCTAPVGSTDGTDWFADDGPTGNLGYQGGGGGGGGAGGGGYCDYSGSCRDTIGGHGGGGGSGGCGGAGGLGGSSGGGSFGIFVIGGSAPTISGNTITQGAGGNGGTGGTGGAGGLGGLGVQGGQVPPGEGNGVNICTGKGGRGGDGGRGGSGSGGGGGCGGGSWGIFTSGVGTQSYCSDNDISGGSAGTGGAGGYAPDGVGGTGANGFYENCGYH